MSSAFGRSLDLAEKYRPRTFDEVIGQRHAISQLQNLQLGERPGAGGSGTLTRTVE